MPKQLPRGRQHSVADLVELLARARRERGLSQRALGARLGLPQSHVSKIERGLTDLRLSSLVEMARHLDLEVVLVPRQMLPALRALGEHGHDEAFLYRLGEPEGSGRDEGGRE